MYVCVCTFGTSLRSPKYLISSHICNTVFFSCADTSMQMQSQWKWTTSPLIRKWTTSPLIRERSGAADEQDGTNNANDTSSAIKNYLIYFKNKWQLYCPNMFSAPHHPASAGWVFIWACNLCMLLQYEHTHSYSLWKYINHLPRNSGIRKIVSWYESAKMTIFYAS